MSSFSKMNKFGFVILHFMAIDATIQCVESIRTCLKESELYEIIIVDNGSSNDTGIMLKKKYDNITNIHVLLSKENQGFAKGNNIGFKFAKTQLCCSFICMMNNDTQILQSDFMEICCKVYNDYPYAVIGPMIIRKDGSLQPVINGIHSRISYIMHRYLIKLELLLSRIGINTEKISAIVMTIISRLQKNDKSSNIERMRCEDVKLHGCCWIFTPVYVHLFNGINDRTFLYREEEILFVSLKKNGLKNAYIPDIKIRHLEDVATDSVQVSSRMKREFIYRHQIDSLKVLIDEMKGFKN